MAIDLSSDIPIEPMTDEDFDIKVKGIWPVYTCTLCCDGEFRDKWTDDFACIACKRTKDDY